MYTEFRTKRDSVLPFAATGEVRSCSERHNIVCATNNLVYDALYYDDTCQKLLSMNRLYTTYSTDHLTPFPNSLALGFTNSTCSLKPVAYTYISSPFYLQNTYFNTPTCTGNVVADTSIKLDTCLRSIAGNNLSSCFFLKKNEQLS